MAGNSSILNSKIPIPLLMFLMIGVFEIPLGFLCDISLLSLGTYIVFVLYIVVWHTRLAILFSWYLVMSLLAVVGVYACETSPVDLYEISAFGHYVNALSTLVLMSMIFFVAIVIYRQRRKREIPDFSSCITQPYSDILAKVLLAFALAIEIYLVSQVYGNPYFNVGVERYSYASEVLSPLASTLKGWLPVFIPCAVIVFKKGNKAFPLAFFAGMLFIYIWTGDKFGTYMFAFSICICCGLNMDVSFHARMLLKTLGLLLLLGALLFLVGYVQRYLLYGTTVPDYMEFLLERLAQQGQIWWSVFEKTVEGGVALTELPQSLVAGLQEGTAAKAPYAGQWKMMLVASDYSAYTYSRIVAGVPYTTTTQATLFYYFSWFSLIAMPFLAVACCKVVDGLIGAVKSGDCLISMIFVKLIIAFNALYTSSEITSLTSPVFIFMVALLFFVTRQTHSIKTHIKARYV